MTISIVLLLAFSLTPVRFTGWLEGVHHLATTVFAPVSQPLRSVAVWLSPPEPGVQDRRLAELRAERDEWELKYRQLRQENTRLRDLIADLQSGRALAPRIAVRYLARPVIAAQSDPGSALLTVRAGTSSGVTERSTVATVSGVQLVGQVASAGGRTCTIQPITSGDHPPLRGAVYLPGREEPLDTLLIPTGDGTLRGGVELPEPTPAEPEPPEIARGAEVRLSDDVWPKTAQQLRLGRVERVEPDADGSGRPVIIVRPDVRLRRVSEVVLRIPLDPEAAAAEISGGER